MPYEIVKLRDDLRALDRYNEGDVSISLMHESESLGITLAAAVAQANVIGDRWWVTRVLVTTREGRGQGLGSIALRRLLDLIARISDLSVYVSPGGYEDNTEQQFRFYLKNGFRRIDTDSDTLIWTKT